MNYLKNIFPAILIFGLVSGCYVSTEAQNLKNAGIQVISSQSFPVILENWGKIKFVSATSQDGFKLSFYLVDDQNDILYTFPNFNGNIWSFDKLKAIAFRDVNRDGLKDVIVIADYVSGAGQNAVIPFSTCGIYFQRGKNFISLPELDEEISQDGQDISISAIIKYTTAKASEIKQLLEQKSSNNRNSKDLALINTAGSRSLPYIIDNITFYLRYAPASSFESDCGSISNDSNLPETNTVSNPYWIAETDVTYELWYAIKTWAINKGYTFTNNNNAGLGGSLGLSGAPPTSENKLHPVTMVTWRDAIVWCNALNEKMGFFPAYKENGEIVQNATMMDCNKVSEPGIFYKGFRLPTSAEWELAARYQKDKKWTPGDHVSGDTTGSCWAGSDVSSVFEDYAWYKDNTDSTQPVGIKKANMLHLFDMSGNVWQWCFDFYPGSAHRVYRGGSWNVAVEDIRLGIVYDGNDDKASYNLGFRLVRTQ